MKDVAYSEDCLLSKSAVFTDKEVIFMRTSEYMRITYNSRCQTCIQSIEDG